MTMARSMIRGRAPAASTSIFPWAVRPSDLVEGDSGDLLTTSVEPSALVGYAAFLDAGRSRVRVGFDEDLAVSFSLFKQGLGVGNNKWVLGQTIAGGGLVVDSVLGLLKSQRIAFGFYLLTDNRVVAVMRGITPLTGTPAVATVELAFSLPDPVTGLWMQSTDGGEPPLLEDQVWFCGARPSAPDAANPVRLWVESKITA